MNKEINPGNKQNIADDMHNVINMLSNSHPFLKEIVQCADKLPSVICYTDYQMKHFSSACKTSIVGVDRTFNLGACFVRTTVFQEKKTEEKGQNYQSNYFGTCVSALGWCISHVPQFFFLLAWHL